MSASVCYRSQAITPGEQTRPSEAWQCRRTRYLKTCQPASSDCRPIPVVGQREGIKRSAFEEGVKAVRATPRDAGHNGSRSRRQTKMGLTRFVCCASESSDTSEVICHVTMAARPVIMVTGAASSAGGHIEYTIVFRIGDKQLEVSARLPTTRGRLPGLNCRLLR